MAMLSARAPSMLPSIKCSNCGDEMELSMLAEHQCGVASRKQNPLPPVPAIPQEDPMAASRVKSSYFFNPSQIGSNNNKPARSVPPKIDSSAANRPYARKDVYAANDTNPSSRRPVDRPMRQQRNPSEDLAPNYDNPFPVFQASPAPKTPNSGFNSPMFFSGLNARAPQPPAASARPAPSAQPAPAAAAPRQQPSLAPPQPQQQPRRPQSPAMQPDLDLSSPNFFAGLRAPAPSAPPQAPQQDSYSQQDEAKRGQFFARKPVNGPSQGAPSQNTYNSYGMKEFTPGAGNQAPRETKPNGGPSRPSRPGGEVDNFIASLKEDAGKPNSANAVGLRPNVSRSNTRKETPLPGLERSPSEPLQKSTSRGADRVPERSATTNDLRQNGYSNFPARTSSRSGPRNDYRDSEGPLPALTYGKTGHEGHYSTNSHSSSASSVSRESAFTGGLSTPPSEVSLVNNFANTSPPRAYEPKGAAGNPYAGNYNPYNPYANEDEPQQMQPKGWAPSVKPYSPSETYSEISIYPPPSKDVTPAPRNNPFSSRGDRNEPSDRPTLLRSATDSSTAGARPRHSCRGCLQPIVGKSVKASDGRLTGRYHRPCFVCTTCRAPFTTAQVYVHNDRPYCEYHYHAVNGSLCTSCDSGIEGQYRETEKREKYHPRCLTCRTCRQVLADEYFEVNRDVYCERHALAEVRRLAPMGYGGSGAGSSGSGGGSNQGGGLAPPAWKAERRRTRLGMM